MAHPHHDEVSGSVVRQNTTDPNFAEWILRIEQPGYRLDGYQVEVDTIASDLELTVGMKVRFLIAKDVISNEVHIYAENVSAA